MTIIDPILLDQVRELRHCELCGHCRLVEPHHVFGRGMGGRCRLDIRENLLAVCRACHDRIHAGNVRRLVLELLVAHREHTTLEAIEEKIYRLRRSPL